MYKFLKQNSYDYNKHLFLTESDINDTFYTLSFNKI